MPSLSLSNTVSTTKNRQMLSGTPSYSFSSDSEGFVGVGSVLTVAVKKLVVTSGASGMGYAHNTVTVTPGVTYKFQVYWYLVGGGTQSAGIVQLGSTDGGTQYGEEIVGTGTSSRFIPITFLATAPTVYIRLVTVTGTKKTTWDTITTEEVGTY
tara:strand:+ start:30 stop:491 length:462 start_codon:yes stop_codon:yes gene_type:complete